MKPSLKTYASEGSCYQYWTESLSETMTFIIGKSIWCTVSFNSAVSLFSFCPDNLYVKELGVLKLPIIA